MPDPLNLRLYEHRDGYWIAEVVGRKVRASGMSASEASTRALQLAMNDPKDRATQPEWR